eukprot:GHVL01027829.1.p1 GENE.GHVL01027829.1~~GHVL01027829.1.p1  ORF type:complete len:1208 (+),score=299.05 GHVL01027829.1:916-4539(+)
MLEYSENKWKKLETERNELNAKMKGLTALVASLKDPSVDTNSGCLEFLKSWIGEVDPDDEEDLNKILEQLINKAEMAYAVDSRSRALEDTASQLQSELEKSEEMRKLDIEYLRQESNEYAERIKALEIELVKATNDLYLSQMDRKKLLVRESMHEEIIDQKMKDLDSELKNQASITQQYWATWINRQINGPLTPRATIHTVPEWHDLLSELTRIRMECKHSKLKPENHVENQACEEFLKEELQKQHGRIVKAESHISYMNVEIKHQQQTLLHNMKERDDTATQEIEKLKNSLKSAEKELFVYKYGRCPKNDENIHSLITDLPESNNSFNDSITINQLKSKIADLEAELDFVKKENLSLEDSVNRQLSINDSLQQDCSLQTAEVTRFSGHVDVLKESISALEKRYDKLTYELERLHEISAEKDKRIRLNADCEQEKENQILGLEDEKRRLASSLSETENLLVEAEERINVLMDNSKKANDNNSATTDAFMSELKSAFESQKEHLKTRIDDLLATNKHHEERYEQLRQKTDELIAEKSQLSERLEQTKYFSDFRPTQIPTTIDRTDDEIIVNDLQRQIEDLKLEMMLMRQASENSTNDNIALQDQVEQYQKLQKNMQEKFDLNHQNLLKSLDETISLRAQLAIAQKKVEEITVVKEKLEMKHNEILMELQNKLELTVGERDEAKEDLEKSDVLLASTVQLLDETRVRVEESHKQIEDMTSKVNNLETEKLKLVEQLDTVVEDHRNCSVRISTLTNEATSLRETCNELKNLLLKKLDDVVEEFSSRAVAIDTSTAEGDASIDELTESTTNVTDFQRQFLRVSTELTRIRADKDEMDEKLASSETEASLLRRTAARLEQTLQSTVAERMEFAIKTERLKILNNEANLALQRVTKERDNALLDLECVKKRILLERPEAGDDGALSADDVLGNIDGECSKNRKLAEQEAELSKYKTEVQVLTKAMEDMNKVVATTNQKLEQSNKINSELNSKTKTLADSNNLLKKNLEQYELLKSQFQKIRIDNTQLIAWKAAHEQINIQLSDQQKEVDRMLTVLVGLPTAGLIGGTAKATPKDSQQHKLVKQPPGKQAGKEPGGAQSIKPIADPAAVSLGTPNAASGNITPRPVTEFGKMPENKCSPSNYPPLRNLPSSSEPKPTNLEKNAIPINTAPVAVPDGKRTANQMAANAGPPSAQNNQFQKEGPVSKRSKAAPTAP